MTLPAYVDKPTASQKLQVFAHARRAEAQPLRDFGDVERLA